MMLYSTYAVLFLELFVQGLAQQVLVPLIYPRKPELTVDAHTDLTLGCRGIEPMRWAFHDAVNAPHYNTTKKEIRNMNNENELEYKYETILTLYNVSHVNVGFYYCHGDVVNFDIPLRSSRIYLFVEDDNNLSVITSENYTFVLREWSMTIPCRPTFQDINITLICNNNEEIMSVHSDNYSKVQQREEYRIRFDPYDGFIIQDHYSTSIVPLADCNCNFRRNNKRFTIPISRTIICDSDLLLYERILIKGPEIAEVGDNITQQCAYIGNRYFPYDKYWLHWKTPSTGNKRIANLELIKLKSYVLEISSLIMNNISTKDEGHYTCQIKSHLNLMDGTDFQLLSFYVNEKLNYSGPRIYYPSGGEIEVNSGENVKLRCAGPRPVTWRRTHAGPWRSYNQRFRLYLEHLYNHTNGLYESYLNIKDVRYTDAGFYSCHENGSWWRLPVKPDKGYIFVKDKKNLYLQRRQEKFPYPYANVTILCLPTSRDVNVTLSMRRLWRSDSEQLYPKLHAYDPRKGFTVQMPFSGTVSATCTFVSETAKDTLHIEYDIDGPKIESEPYITGPHDDVVIQGQNLELSCAVVVYNNVSDDALHWSRFPNHFSANEINVETRSIDFRQAKVLISKLRMYNATKINEGWYLCVLPYNNATAEKFISVYETFSVEPSIYQLQYDYAYIGQPLVLQCKVNFDHNVGFQMSWATSNEKVENSIKTEYIRTIRHTRGEITLQIDNVTDGNAGNYVCKVFDFANNRRRDITKNIQVKNGVKPRIIRSNFNNQEEIDIEIDETVKLTCFAEGDPQPEITWVKDSNVVRILGQHYGFASNNSELTVYYVQGSDAGQYTCIAENPFGLDSRTVTLRVNTVSVSGYITGLISMIILVVGVAVLLARSTYKQKKRQQELRKAGLIDFITGDITNLNPFLNIVDQAALLPYDTKWEIPRNKIELGRNLGSGCFGLVVEATVSDFFDGKPERTVAVKMLHKNSKFMDLNNLICELKIMTHLGEHVNLINLLGACTENIAEKKLLLVIEYCQHGSLRDYLMANRCNFINLLDPDTELLCVPTCYNDSLPEIEAIGSESGPTELLRVTTLELLRWALQVARGMEFLAARQILHGDLAARNVLLAENYVIKISDFGLSKTLSSSGDYKKKSQCPLPVKWMAIESIRDKTFSTQSDVWAFGVVLWELFSLARTPYADLEPDFRFYRKLESGYRLERPEYSTREMYQVMRECWHAQPQRRPTFSALVCTLVDLLQSPNTSCSGADDVEELPGSSGADWIALDILAPEIQSRTSNAEHITHYN